MIIPYTALEAETLQRILEEFVTRSFDEFSSHEASPAQRIKQVMRQLEHGEAVVVYDDKSQTVNIISAHEAQVLPHD